MRPPPGLLAVRATPNWAIGTYKASAGQSTESKLPGSFCGATGTPEQGIDETCTLYAGPRAEK